jgi:hypothetical protein
MHAQNQKPEDHQSESDIVKAVHGLEVSHCFARSDYPVTPAEC